MDRIKREDIEKNYGKMIDERPLSIEGFSKKLHFEIYDGFAYCQDFEGSEYILKYPKMSFVKGSPDAQEAIRSYLGIDKNKDITVLDIIQRFNTFYKDGVLLEYKEDEKKYVEKNTFVVNY